MAGKTYMTKGYSSYTNLPARHGDLDYGPKNPVGPNDFETMKKKKQTPVPTFGYNFSGSHTKFELLKEYVYAPNMASGSKYAPMNHYQGYVPNYGINYDNTSPYMKASSSYEHYLSKPPVHGYPSEESRGVHSGHDDLARVSPVRAQNFPGPNKPVQSLRPPTKPSPLTPMNNNIIDDTATRSLNKHLPLAAKPDNIGYNFTYT